MSPYLTEHLNHYTTAFVAEVISKWLDEEEINSFMKTIKDWQKKIALPGILIFKKISEKVEKGETLAEVHFNKVKNVSSFEKESQGAFMISEKPPDFRPFIIERIGAKV